VVERSKAATPEASFFHGTLAGDGRPGPIEHRMGRRLLRLIDPESKEGIRLLCDGQVQLTGPDGEMLGCLKPHQAYARLRERLERCLAAPGGGDRTALEQGLDQLRSWCERIGST
jgi:hypothetical protein